MNYLVYVQKGNKKPVLIARTKYQRDGMQLLMSYKKGYVQARRSLEIVYEKG